MRPYFDRHPGDEKKAVRHYVQNIRLAESLGPSLSILEVTLRNAIIRQLEIKTGRLDWYESFRKNPKLNKSYRYIKIAIQHIKARGEEITNDKINGELTLGFWVSLFNAEYERILWKDLRMAFPNMPKTQRKRKNVSAPLNSLRLLRNRVYHNENISWSISSLEKLHETIITVICWINPRVTLWMKCVDRFDKVAFNVKLQWYGLIKAIR